jgi:putative spermidine/putrescine transport system permease protein
MKQKLTFGQVLIVILFLFYMLVPILATYLFSIATRWDRSVLPEGYTLEGYVTAAQNPYFFSTLRNSLILSLATVAVSLVIVVPTVYWVHIRLPGAKPLLDFLMILPFGIPGVVLALALVQVYNFPPLARSAILLTAAEVV